MFDAQKFIRAQIECGLNGRIVSERAGITPTQLSRIRRGDVEPLPATIKGLADALGVPVTDLLQDNPQAVA